MSDDLHVALATALQRLRTDRGLTGAALADRSGVSRAMISRIENGDVQPTASLLGRLSAALGITLSELIASAERGERRLARRDEQPVWTDPDTGYTRRAVSPTSDGRLELVEVHLPPGARVSFPAEAYAFTHHQIWVMEGTLEFREGETAHLLDEGDCLRLGPAAPCEFHNPGEKECRYLVAVTRRAP
ncbi:XRE family transcriptional regulator [Nocardiopsis sp. N85]|uniref:helix-turn-helix domain-containing protein n=1 Tax=Nocardiopsis sp. N85 TaxID=3029400 RepID=UPI00237F8FE0|nr:XRE family transcriptional regulator [Nocardiopsis sp. N85]MDE3722117.1 XRE family transcriptional regulator [Nocardiopsis sp. N85]